jgi:hypothetical protein
MMREKTDITDKLLDRILREAKNKDIMSIERYLESHGYNKRMARGIRTKLVNDGYAVSVNDDEYSIRISVNGWLMLKDGGYVRQRIKEYIPPTTSLVGCVTGTISLIWQIIETFLQ